MHAVVAQMSGCSSTTSIGLASTAVQGAFALGSLWCANAACARDGDRYSEPDGGARGWGGPLLGVWGVSVPSVPPTGPSKLRLQAGKFWRFWGAETPISQKRRP